MAPLKFIVDGYTLGYGWGAVRTVTSPLFDLASGNLKKSGNEFKYLGADLIEHMIGPFFDDLWKTGEEAGTIGQIESAEKHPENKGAKLDRSLTKYAVGQFPALQQIPQVAEELKKPDKKTGGGAPRRF